MKSKHVGLTAALLIAGSFLAANAVHAQEPGFGGPPPPPPWLSGSGGPVFSGSAPIDSGSGGDLGGGPGGGPGFGPGGPAGGPGDGPGGDRGGCGNGGTAGLPTGTFEALTVRVSFTPTSGTTTSARGILQAVGICTDSGSLDVHTTGVTAGTYTVTADTSTSSTATTLGTFTVRAAPSTTSTSGTLGGPPPPPPGRPCNALFGSHRGIQFPSGFDPFTITSLAISDSNSNVLFTADLTTITNGSLVERTPAVAGSTVSGATGSVFIRAVAIGGTDGGVLAIHASGLPDSTSYTYALNGTDEGTVTTDASGNLNFAGTENPPHGTATLPSGVDLFTVSSVTVLDSSNDVILSAGF